MSLLLDTHALLWGATDVSRLSPAALEEVATAERVLVSPVNAYELVYKYTRGKLPVAGALLRDSPGYLAMQRFDMLPVTLAHAEVAGRLPTVHRDPFDRLLAAQALGEDLTPVSIDMAFDQFGVRRLW